MTPQVDIKPSSVFLASGGAKGITAQCVIRMAQDFQCKWILLGRSEITEPEPVWAHNCSDKSELKKRIMDYFLAQGDKPTPMKIEKKFKEIISTREIHQTLQTLEQAGVQAEYLSVDITDADTLREELAAATERLGPIAGILHGAGNLADKLIEKKTEQDFEAVYSPKVRGLENLLRHVDTKHLEYLILFSSVSGFYGNAGQTDYALANEILTKSAHFFKRNNPNCHAAAINWGAWDSGMVSPELKKVFEMNNVKVIPVEGGTEMLVNELDRSHPQTVQSIIGSPLPEPVTSLETELRTHRIHRHLSLEANPFLVDHAIGGYPVLPATCAMSWIAQSSEQLYPGYKFFSLADFRVLKGIVFDKNFETDYVIQLEEISKDNDSGIEFDATIYSINDRGKIRYHFKARSKLLPKLPDSPIYESIDLNEDGTFSELGQSFYKDDGLSLFHGPSFQGIDKILNISSDRVTARLSLLPVEEKRQGQFQVNTFNPYIRDAELHPIWVWSQFFHKSGALPAKTGLFEQYALPTFDEVYYVTIEIVSKTVSGLTSNIIAHDGKGKMYSGSYGSAATLLPLPLNF